MLYKQEKNSQCEVKDFKIVIARKKIFGDMIFIFFFRIQ